MTHTKEPPEFPGRFSVTSEFLRRNLFKGKERVVFGNGNDGTICPNRFLDESVARFGMYGEAGVYLVMTQGIDHLIDGHFEDSHLSEGFFLTAAGQ